MPFEGATFIPQQESQPLLDANPFLRLEGLLKQIEKGVKEELARVNKEGPRKFSATKFTLPLVDAQKLIQRMLRQPSLSEDDRLELMIADEELARLGNRMGDLVFFRKNPDGTYKIAPGYQESEAYQLLKDREDLMQGVREAVESLKIGSKKDQQRMPN